MKPKSKSKYHKFSSESTQPIAIGASVAFLMTSIMLLLIIIDDQYILNWFIETNIIVIVDETS